MTDSRKPPADSAEPEPPITPFRYLGPALKRLRIKRGLEQAETARLSGLTKAMMCGYEKGSSRPNLGTLEKILTALRVDLGELHREMERERGQEEGRPPSAPEEDLPDILQALARSLEEASQQVRDAARR